MSIKISHLREKKKKEKKIFFFIRYQFNFFIIKIIKKKKKKGEIEDWLSFLSIIIILKNHNIVQ
jgi:hypothetical protein